MGLVPKGLANGALKQPVPALWPGPLLLGPLTAAVIIVLPTGLLRLAGQNSSRASPLQHPRGFKVPHKSPVTTESPSDSPRVSRNILESFSSPERPLEHARSLNAPTVSWNSRESFSFPKDPWNIRDSPKNLPENLLEYPRLRKFPKNFLEHPRVVDFEDQANIRYSKGSKQTTPAAKQATKSWWLAVACRRRTSSRLLYRTLPST